MGERLYRVQAADGRGPYRPGFSHHWSDAAGPAVKPWWIELNIGLGEAIRMIPQDMHTGCAFEWLQQLDDWFTASERLKLDRLGYYIVKFRPDKIVARTPTQVVFACNGPLSGLPRHSGLIRLEAA